MQACVSVRDEPSLDDELHRLRPKGYGISDMQDKDDGSPVIRSPEPRAILTLGRPSVSSSPDTDNAISRPISAMRFSSNVAEPTIPESRRRVQIQDDSPDEDGGRKNRTSTMAHQPLLSPSSAVHQRGGGVLGGGLAVSHRTSSITLARLSFGRTNGPLLLSMPPPDMPQLHQAAWYNDLDTLLELLKTSSESLDGLIWYSKKLYPAVPGFISSTGNDGTADPLSSTCLSRPVRSTAAPKAPLPQVPSMETATSALKALLQRDFLTHACHPLTIAAANGNERIVDELIKAMLEDAQTRHVTHIMTWHAPPEGLPPGCPWITPLAAAALSGSGECVRLIAQAIVRRKSLTDDRSTYGCFRFRPITVAQTADAVHSLFKYGCCHADTLRYSLCDAARRLAKRDGSGASSMSVHFQKHKSQKQVEQQQQQQQRRTQPHQKLGNGVAGENGVMANFDCEEELKFHGSPEDSPRAMSYTTTASCAADVSVTSTGPLQQLQNPGGGEVGVALKPTVSLPANGNANSFSATDGSASSIKAAELMLFRARLYHDSLGRPLARSLCEFTLETLTAVAALAAMVEQGLHPDRFLSHAEHANLTSTSLLMIIVQSYPAALRSSAGGGGGGGNGVAHHTDTGAGTLSCLLSGGSVTMAAAMASSTASTDVLVSGDLSSVAREGLHALVAELLAHDAMVDNPPREGCRQVGGFHIASPHGPEAPLHYAFIHGPQELVVMLLQYSSLHPEAPEDLLGLIAPSVSGEGDEHSYSAGAQLSSAKSFYGRRPGWQQSQRKTCHPHHQLQLQQSQKADQPLPRCRQGSVPWGGDRRSPLLAFAAKMQGALLEGSLPLWLHSGRFAELMEELIKASIETDARMVTCDLAWLVAELFERCISHEFDAIWQLRKIDGGNIRSHIKSKARVEESGKRSSDSAELRGPKIQGGPQAPLREGLQDTVITVDPVVPASPSSSSAAAESCPTIAETSQGEGQASWLNQRPPGRHVHHRAAEAKRARRKCKTVDGDDDSTSNDSRDGSEELHSSSGSSLSRVSSSDLDNYVDTNDMPLTGTGGNFSYSMLTNPEDSITLSIVHSLYRNTADAITSLHQVLIDKNMEPLQSSLAGVGIVGAAGGAGGATGAAALVDWTALLRLVARIAATTLNPPKSHGAAATQISVFTTAKAVNQLLYARDWARGGVADDGDGNGGGPSQSRSVVDIDLLRAIARRHPHEAARLIHGIDLMRVELKGYRWDSIPMSLDQDFYAVLTRGEPVKLSVRQPTVAPASIAAAAAAEEERRRAAAAAALASAKGLRKSLKSRAKIKGSTVAPVDAAANGEVVLTAPAAVAAAAQGDAACGTPTTGTAPNVEESPMTREDILQACIFSNMWTVLTHFLLSSTRLPGYMGMLQQLRNSTYKYAIMGQMTQYGSIPVVLGLGMLLALLGLLARGLQRTFRLAGNLVLAGYVHLEERLQPAMNTVGRRLQLDKVQRKVGRIVRRVDQLATRATGGGVGVIGINGSKALMTVRIIPRYLSFLRLLLDPDSLTELWLGVTQFYKRSRGASLDSESGGSGGGVNERRGLEGGAGGREESEDTDAPGPAYMSWRTTRVVCNRVPLACAAAMPSSLLYKLASSPQVNGELFASPVMRAVIVWRWQHFTRYVLLLQFIEHLIYLAFFMVYAFSLSYSPQMFSRILGQARTTVFDRDGCTLAPSGLQKFLLITLGVMTITCVVQELRQMFFFKLGWLRQPWNWMDLGSSTIVSTIITLHLTCNTDAEWLRGLAAIEVALLFMRLLYFAMADDRLGSFFRMVIEVLRDCWLFFVFLGILFIGWGLALTVMQGQSTTIQNTYLQLFTMIFGDFQMSLLQSANAGSRGLNHLWRMFASLYQILVTIILLNLLIAIINDSYERINDNEACESLRNKLTLIVEAESVLPSSMARRMLESLAQTDLYVITAEAATVASDYEECGTGGEPTSRSSGTTRRPLAPPARWSGRMGETKRFVGSIVDHLSAQQEAFQARALSLLTALSAGQTGGGDALPARAMSRPGTGRESTIIGGVRRVLGTSKRINAGAHGGAAVGLRGAGGAAATSSTHGSVIDIADSEAFAEVSALGGLLRNMLTELKQEREDIRRRQDESAAALTDLHEAVERMGQEVTRSAADSAAVAALAAGAGRFGVEGLGFAQRKVGCRQNGDHTLGGSGDFVLIERSEIEAIALKAAEQAATMAVQGVLREMRAGRGDNEP